MVVVLDISNVTTIKNEQEILTFHCLTRHEKCFLNLRILIPKACRSLRNLSFIKLIIPYSMTFMKWTTQINRISRLVGTIFAQARENSPKKFFHVIKLVYCKKTSLVQVFCGKNYPSLKN